MEVSSNESFWRAAGTDFEHFLIFRTHFLVLLTRYVCLWTRWGAPGTHWSSLWTSWGEVRTSYEFLQYTCVNISIVHFRFGLATPPPTGSKSTLLEAHGF